MKKLYFTDAERAAAVRASYLRNRDRVIESRRKFRRENADRINADRRKNYHSNEKLKEKVWASNLRRRCGCTAELYRDLLETQKGLCAVCCRPMLRQKSGQQRACVDHCHKSNVVRGLLCHRCNIFLGMLDDQELFAAALAYQKKSIWKCQQPPSSSLSQTSRQIPVTPASTQNATSAS